MHNRVFYNYKGGNLKPEIINVDSSASLTVHGPCITVVYLSSFELAGLEMMIYKYPCSCLTLKILTEYKKQLT